jgi:hypothetical protein
VNEFTLCRNQQISIAMAEASRPAQKKRPESDGDARATRAVDRLTRV